MNPRLLLGYALCASLVVAMGRGSKSENGILGGQYAQQSRISSSTASPLPQSSLSPSIAAQPKPTAEQSSTLDLAKLENSVRPAVIWVSVFDASGKLLRTQSGFFISSDGRLITTARTIENGINAVAKTADGGIYNVGGILAASTPLNIAILQADVKGAPFLTLNRNPNLAAGARVVIIGSGLAGNDGAAREAKISTQESDRLEIAANISESSIGSPVIDAKGEGIGVVVSSGPNAAVRPSSSIEDLLSGIQSNAVPTWPTAEARATPKPSPTAKPRLVYAPAPSFPPQVSRPGASGSGRFRLSFDARGNVTNVQMVQSTGNKLFDEAAVTTFRQWKAAPGREGAVTVPITFQSR